MARPTAGTPVEDERRPRSPDGADHAAPGYVVVMGASAGGLKALEEVVAGLPGDLPAPIVVVQHLDPHHRSLMPELLAHHTGLGVRAAEPGQALPPGTLTLAVPNAHLVVTADATLALEDTPAVRFVRPSIDVLFASAARHLGSRVVAVVLTGTGSDGADGVTAVHEAGGRVVVQDPDTAQFDAMPRAAIATGAVDRVVPLDRLATTLIDLVTRRGSA